MPFEPRIVPPAEPLLPQDDELAPDLQLLAEQLQADAQHLAARYPAPAWRPLAAPPRRHLLRWAGAAVALLLVGVGVRLSSTWPAADPEPAAGPGAGVSHTADWSRSAPSVLHADQPAQPLTVPAMLFHSLTPPEQEAVLDLVEDEVLSQASLSI
jgi:hypothetical protein